MWSGQEIDAAIIAHAPLVARLAGMFVRRLPMSVDVQDLRQAGMIGLLEAATRFDPGQGLPFEAFAISRIRGAFLDELREMDWVPRSVRRARRDLDAAVRDVEQQVGRTAREQEVADELRLTLPAYQRLVAAAQRQAVISLDGLLEDPEDDYLEHYVADSSPGPEEQFAERRLHVAIGNQLRQLSERHQLLMRLHYDDDLNWRAIGERLGVTESRVCQMHADVVQALRLGLRAHGAAAVSGRVAK